MADTLSPEDIALKFQEFDRQNSSTPPNATVAVTPQTDIAEKFRLYYQQQNRDAPTQDIAVALPSDIAEKFRQFDESKATQPDNGVGWTSDKVRRVAQGASEGAISAIEGGLNAAGGTLVDIGKGVSQKPSGRAQRQEYERQLKSGNFDYDPASFPAEYARRARAVNEKVFDPIKNAGEVVQQQAEVANQLKKDQREVYGANPKYDATLSAAIAQGIGSSLPTMVVALATRGATLPGHIATALQLYQENFDSAVEAGQTPETAHKSGMLAIPLTIFEELGDIRLGKRLRDAMDAAFGEIKKRGLKEIAKDAAKEIGKSAFGEGLTEGAQEAGKQVIENEILGYKDENATERAKNVGLNALVGGIAGGILSAPTAGIRAIRGYKSDVEQAPIETQDTQDVAGNRATTVIPVEQKLPFETVAPGEEIPESGAWVGRSVDYHFHDPEGRWPDKKSTGKIVSIFRGPNMESGRPRISVRIRWQNGTESEHGSSAGRGPSGIVNATQAVGAALKSGGVTIRDEPSPAESVAVQPEQSQPPTVQDSLTVQSPAVQQPLTTQPPPEAVQIATELNRPLVQATGPDGQQYWFTFDGYWDTGTPKYGIQTRITLASDSKAAPEVPERGSQSIEVLEGKGYTFDKSQVPTIEQWQQSSKQASLPVSDVPVQEITTPSEPQKSIGVQAAIDLLPKSGLDEGAIKLAAALLNEPLFQNTDLASKLQLEIKDSVELGGKPVSGLITDKVVQLSRAHTDAKSAAHELFHLLDDALTPADAALVEKWRLEAIQERYGNDAPVTMVSGNMTSEEALQAGVPIEDYPLINRQEFLAEMLSGKYQAEQEAKGDEQKKSFINRLKDWVRGIIEALRKAFGMNPTQQRFYEEILSGKRVTTPESGVKFEEKRASFVKNPKQAAAQEALAQDRQQENFFGKKQQGQTQDLVKALERTDVQRSSPRTMNLLSYPSLVGIATTGERMVGQKMTYNQIKTLSDPYEIQAIAQVGDVQAYEFEQRLAELRKKREVALTEITSPQFISQVKKESSTKLLLDLTQTNQRAVNATLSAEMLKVQRAMREGNRSETEIARLQGQIDSLRNAGQSSAAMVQVMDDMVRVLASTPEGVDILFQEDFGTRGDILSLYRDLKRSADQPIHSENLLRWAAYLIQKSKTVRENLATSLMLQDSGFRANLSSFESSLLQGLETDPAKTIMGLRRGAAREATQVERLKMAWRTLHKRVKKDLDDFMAVDDAVRMGEQVLADPQYRATVQEMRQDANWISGQAPMRVNIDTSIMMPDNGERIDLSETYQGDNDKFAVVQAKVEKAISRIKEWLIANPEHTNHGAVERDLQTLEDNYTGNALQNPIDRVKVMSWTFGILWNVADKIGGRAAVPVRKAIRRADDAHRLMGDWTRKWAPQLGATRINAMKSQGYEWGSGGVSYKKSNDDYERDVSRPIQASHNRQGVKGFRVGDTLPTGRVVTVEDMNDLRLQSEATRDSFRMLRRAGFDPYEKVTIGDYDIYQGAIQTSENMTPRTFNRRVMALGELVARNNAILSAKESSEAERGAAMREITNAIDKNWDEVGPSLITDRHPDHAQPTVFDGGEGAMKAVAEQIGKGEPIETRIADGTTTMRYVRNPVESTQELFERISGLTGHSVEEVRGILVPEWSRMISSWHAQAKESETSTLTMRSEEQSNPFTKGRERTLAPYGFYEYGFPRTSAINRFAAGMQSRSMDELVGALTQAEQDLNRLEREMQQEAIVLAREGSKSPEREAIQRQKYLRASGDTFDRYDALQSRKKAVSSILKALSGQGWGDDDLNMVAGRVVANVSGMLLGTATTGKNVFDGPVAIGRLHNMLMASQLLSAPTGLWFGFIRNRIPFLYRLAGAGVRGSARLAQGTILATYRAVFDPTQRNSRSFMFNAITPALQALGEGTYNDWKSYKEMIDRGIVEAPSSMEAETATRIFGSWLTNGVVPDSELTTGEKVALAAMSPIELYLMFNRRINPTLGDAELNLGVFRSLKLVEKQHALKLAEIADRVRNGVRAWDRTNPNNPVNLISFKEMFPKGLFRWQSSESDMQVMESVYQKAGLEFQSLAFRFINSVLDGKPGRLMTEEEFNKLARHGIAESNKSTFANQPGFTRSKSFWGRFLGMFYGWATRILSTVLNRFSVSGQVGRRVTNQRELLAARAGQWATAMMWVVFPLLIAGALFSGLSNLEGRKMRKVLYNQDSAYRLPWERDGLRSQALGWVAEGLNSIPIIGAMMSTAINDTPARASFDPSFVMVDKAKDLVKWASGVAQTGDWGYKTPELVMGFVPDVRILLSRSSIFEGKNDLNSAANLLRRYGPVDQMRPQGGRGGGVLATELSPFADKMANYAASGDMEAFQETYNEAVAKARELGKANPEQVVRESFKSKNPYERVFKRKISEDERQQILAKASPEERQAIEQVEQRFAQAAASIGSSTSFTAEQRDANKAARSGGGSTGYVSTASGGAGSGLSGSASTRRTGSRFGGIRSRGTRRSRLGTRRRSIGGRVKSSLRIGKGMRSRTIKSSKRRSLSLASLR